MSKDHKIHPAIQDALSLDGDPQRIKAYYAKWAQSYDHDVEGHYTAPRIIVGMLSEYMVATPDNLWPARAEMLIADAGCGTGLVGSVLHSA